MIGTVVAISCGMYKVESEGVIYQTTPRGLFRHLNDKVYVGDKVKLEENNFLIDEILPRKSFIKRPAIANIDQIVVTLSIKEPDFSYYLACKYLTFASYHNIKAILVLTKNDLDDKGLAEQIKKDFAQIGVETYIVSQINNQGIEELKKALDNKISCLIGQSGVGKSSLLNLLSPHFDRPIGEYSSALGRGKHQTKEIILLPFLNGYIADTPGFSSLFLDIKDYELNKYFPGFMQYALKCYYSDCKHISESKCEVKKALEEGIIPTIIYDCYIKLLEEIKSL